LNIRYFTALSSLLFLTLTLTVSGTGTPPFRQFNSSNGLPSSTTFDILQDREGFIWIATQGGAVRFDGKNYVTYKAADGLNSTSVVAMTENGRGEIFFGTYQSGINVLRNGKFYNYFYDREGNQFACSYLFSADTDGSGERLWSYKNSSFLYSLRDKKGSGERLQDVEIRKVLLNRAEMINNRMLISTSQGLFTLNEGSIARLSIKGLPEEPLYKITPSSDGSFLVSGKKVIYRIKNDRVIRTYNIRGSAGSSDINEMLEDSFGNIWFSLMNSGLYLIRKDTGEETDLSQQTGLKNTSVTSMMQDREGNVWISTYGKGVFCFHDLYISVMNEYNNLSSNNIKNVMLLASGEIAAGTSDGLNIFRDGKFFRPPSFALRAQPEYIHHFHVNGAGLTVAGVYSFRGLTRFNYNGLEFRLINRPAFFIRKDGSVLAGLFDNGIDLISDPDGAQTQSDPLRLFGESLKSVRVNDLTEDKNGTVWVAASRGICRISGLTLNGSALSGKQEYYPDDPVLSNSVISVTEDKNGNIWFAGERGIAVYDIKANTLRSWQKYNGTDVSQAACIAFDKENRLWVGTMTGLLVFDSEKTLRFNRYTGFPAAGVQALFYDPVKNRMLTGTSDGIVIFDIGMYENYPQIRSTVKILTIQNGNKSLPFAPVINIGPEERNMTIEYSALLFSAPDAVSFHYKLDGSTGTTESEYLTFANLSPGEHILTIAAHDDNSGTGNNAQIVINVIPYFTETGLFRILLTGAFLLIVFALVKIRLGVQAGKTAEKLDTINKINEMKHQALSAMMNPHFVFNSLNSVQYLVNSNRNEDANNYIAMMAQLMRKNLDASARGFILVSEETERLKLYLELEKMRFSDRFRYEIIIDPGISPDKLEIPNMIIQPFVENSIWHGLSESGSEGLITIQFEMIHEESSEQILRIKITDNGIGYSRSIKKKTNDHISRGMSIIEERLKLLSKKLDIEKPIVIDDLGEKSDDASGTEIIIYLPEPLIRHVKDISAH